MVFRCRVTAILRIFANGQYTTDYMTFFEQLDCDSNDICIILTQSTWTTEYTLYAFKITDGPIRFGI